MSPSLRILYFNWVDYLDDEKRGGGVSVYQRNLIGALEDRSEIETSFLCAGVSYDLPARAPRWEEVRHGPDHNRARRYEILNSAVLAPAHHGFGNPAQVRDAATEAVFVDFIEQTGPYDVIHFNTLEGLPAGVLEQCARWPRMRVVLALHNYYPFCPQVNLWHQERETCTDFDAGRDCVNCLPFQHDARHLQLAGGLAYRLKCAGLRPGTWTFDTVFRWTMRIGGRAARGLRRFRNMPTRRRRTAPGELRPLTPPDGAPFAARRADILALINTHCDAVLCVSDAVRRLAIGFGVNEEITHTSYIGTREAKAFAVTEPRPFPQAGDGTLRLAYLGYMRRDKGFYFLLQALEALPDDLSRRLRIAIAAPRGDSATMARLKALSARLAELTFSDGYSHDDLDRLLDGVDVGLVPVLWHDNLPQVAIEMHARHIPLLCAAMGGAPELGRCPAMTFPPGDATAFADRITTLLAGGVDFETYWQGAMAPVEMAAHLDDLMTHYQVK